MILTDRLKSDLLFALANEYDPDDTGTYPDDVWPIWEAIHSLPAGTDLDAALTPVDLAILDSSGDDESRMSDAGRVRLLIQYFYGR